MALINKLDGRTVFVAGASRGIGLEFVRQLAVKGCTIYATHRGSDVPEDLSAMVNKYGNQVTPLSMDVTDEASIQAAAKRVKDLGVRLDCLINNAGVMQQDRQGTLDQLPAEDMLRCFTVNTLGPLLVSKHFLPLMNKGTTPPPIIANMTSKMGSVDDNSSGGYYPYRASKCALNIVTKSMAIDLKEQGIAVVLMHPGYVRTDMTGGRGLIDVDQCVSGLIEEIEKTTLGNFRFVDFKHDIVPW